MGNHSAIWVKLFVIASLASLLPLGVGFFAGIFLLIALNGFSESQAMPIIVGYIGIVLLVTLAFSSLSSWWIMKRWREATSISFASVLGVNILSLLGILLVAAAIFFVWIRLK